MAAKNNPAPDQLATACRQQLLRLFEDPAYQPLHEKALLALATTNRAHRLVMRRMLGELLAEGVVVELKHKGLALAAAADLVTGHLSFARSGAAFLAAVDTGREYFIPRGQTGTGLPHDKVLARVSRGPRPGTGKRLGEAVVVRVVERACRQIVGVLKQSGRLLCVAPMHATMPQEVIVPAAGQAVPGDRVVVRLDPWTDPDVSPTGEICEVIGPADNPALDTIAVIKSYELPESFPQRVVAEAERLQLPNEEELARRRDLRRSFVFTVDPETARDFDDAISLDRSRDGQWRLGVHIADVAHFVRRGSVLDEEARRRGTSVYLPDLVIPMLPEQLANHLCSLVPDADRLTFSVFMVLSDDGGLLKWSFSESVIRSRLRLAYPQVLGALQTPPDTAYPPAGLSRAVVAKLKQAHELAQKLRQRRIQDGALMLDLPETSIHIGKDGRIAEVTVEASDVSHQLIEEFMLLANECVCRELSARNLPHLHRVHEDPDPEKLEDLAQLFAQAGLRPGFLGQRSNLVRLIQSIAGKPQAHAWYTAILRSMKRAMYDVEPIPHYGLAKEYYTHFTSPIRRYPDLIIHRLLKNALLGKPPAYALEELRSLALHCTEREQLAAEAEREVLDVKKVRFFAEQLASGNLLEYDAIVMDVTNFGVFVDLPAVQTTGLIHVSLLQDDFYDFDEARNELIGRRTGQRFSIGSTLKVVVVRVDAAKRMIDFAPAGVPKASGKGVVVRPRPGKRPAGHQPAKGGLAARLHQSQPPPGGRRRRRRR